MIMFGLNQVFLCLDSKVSLENSKATEVNLAKNITPWFYIQSPNKTFSQPKTPMIESKISCENVITLGYLIKNYKKIRQSQAKIFSIISS